MIQISLLFGLITYLKVIKKKMVITDILMPSHSFVI